MRAGIRPEFAHARNVMTGNVPYNIAKGHYRNHLAWMTATCVEYVYHTPFLQRPIVLSHSVCFWLQKS